MNIFKSNPECYKCKNSGWIINSLGVYIYCPVCHDSKLIRILKDKLFKLILMLFKLSSDLLKKINWVSAETLHFERLYNVELEGKVEKRQELPFENYEVAFEKGNTVFKNKISYKLISEYVMGYTVNLELLKLAVKELVLPEKVETICISLEQVHGAALIGKDRSQEFYKELNEALKN